MKKKGRNILIGLLIVFALIRFTGVLSFNNVASTSTEPNLKMDSRFVGSNLVFPKRLDFAYYHSQDSIFGSFVVVQRLMAMPGDVIESKKGEFFVNGENIDSQLNLRRMFSISDAELKSIDEDVLQDTSILRIYDLDGNISISLDEDYVKSLNFKLERYFSNSDVEISKDIKSKSQSWNFYNFGPITVPANRYFFMGDNRDNSLDSRHKGFINKEDIKGTLLFQF